MVLEDLQYEFNLDDEVSKITSLAFAPLAPTTRAVSVADSANRIGQVGAASLTFDTEGQTASKTDVLGASSYQWDARGRLVQASLPNGQIVSYGYDALGRRTSRMTGGSTTTFQYDGADVVIDRVSGGNAIDYLTGPDIDNILRQTGGTFGSLYYLQDHLGSTTALTSTGGALVEQQQYEVFGANGGSLQTRYGYTGRERDELTGLMYYRARWFDSQQGRFLSEDPLGFDESANFYTYGENNPISYTDQLGLWVYWDPSGCGGRGCVHGQLNSACPIGNCDEIKEDMRKLTDSLKNRRLDLKDNIARYKARGIKNPHSHPSTKSIIKGHQDRIANEEAALKRCKHAYEISKCGDCPTVPVPVPIPAVKPEPKQIPRVPIWMQIPARIILPITIILPCPIRPGCPRPDDQG
jgi:RHS repeat-associated protein